MQNRTTSLDECTLEQLAADSHLDALRNLADEMEARELFLSEATAAARREPSEVELHAEYLRITA